MQAASPASDAATADAVQQPEVLVERPPPGLARGSYAWPPWGIALVGGAVFVLVTAYLILRLRKRRPR